MATLNRFPENRYAALEEVQELLHFRRLELLAFLETLAKADDAFLRYSFGNLSVTFTINDGLLGCITSAEESETAYAENTSKTQVCIGLELEKRDVQTSTTYRFSLDELKALHRGKQHRIAGAGGHECG